MACTDIQCNLDPGREILLVLSVAIWLIIHTGWFKEESNKDVTVPEMEKEMIYSFAG